LISWWRTSPDGGRSPCDTAITAHGVCPTEKKAQELSQICRVIPIGEVLKGPGNIMAAVEQAYEAVAQL
jgi:hypothetical protein